MYRVKIDGRDLYYPGDKEAVLINPVLKLTAGYAGEFEAVVPPQNPEYENIYNRRSMITIYQDKKEIFYGEVRKIPKKNRYNEKSIYCTGAISFLADSIQPQAEYHDITPRGLLETMLSYHNEQVEDRKKIYIGAVTVTDKNNSLYRYTNFENTLKAIREKLVNRLGGYLRLRHEASGKLYLDWLRIEEYGKYSEQPIEFGLNLLDYTESKTAENVITALIPLGAKIEEEGGSEEVLEKYTQIDSVNGGKNYIYNQEAVDTFGWVWDTHNWDDVTEPKNLLTKAKEFLESNQFEDLELTLTAADLSDLYKDYERFEIGDRILCRAKPYGMNVVLPVLEMTIPLQKPNERKLTLSSNQKLSYTEQQTKAYAKTEYENFDARKVQNEAVRAAINNVTALMTGSKGGYKLTEFDEDGKWLRDLYMDTPDKNTAVNILQINSMGIAGSKNGYNGPYTVGMTLDGQVLGERIAAGSINAAQLSVAYKNSLADTYATKTALSVTDGKIEGKVSKGTLSSSISQEAGKIAIKSNRLSIISTNFSLSESGIAKMKGAEVNGQMATEGEVRNATRRTEVKGGKVDFYCDVGDHLAGCGTIMGDASAWSEYDGNNWTNKESATLSIASPGRLELAAQKTRFRMYDSWIDMTGNLWTKNDIYCEGTVRCQSGNIEIAGAANADNMIMLPYAFHDDGSVSYYECRLRNGILYNW